MHDIPERTGLPELPATGSTATLMPSGYCRINMLQFPAALKKSRTQEGNGETCGAMPQPRMEFMVALAQPCCTCWAVRPWQIGWVAITQRGWMKMAASFCLRPFSCAKRRAFQDSRCDPFSLVFSR